MADSPGAYGEVEPPQQLGNGRSSGAAVDCKHFSDVLLSVCISQNVDGLEGVGTSAKGSVTELKGQMTGL